MERQKIWTRMGQWFKSSDRGSPRSTESLPSGGGVSGERRESLSSAVLPRNEGLETGGRSAPALSPIERLEQQQSRVAGLVESIQDHLTSQAQRTDSIAVSLEKLAGSLAHLPDSASTQLGMLEKISDEVARSSGSARRLEDTLGQLPQLADAQREAMVSVGRQLEASCEATGEMASTLSGVRDVVAQVGETTTASTESLKNLRSELTNREQRVATLLSEQTGRLDRFAWTLVGLVAAILIVAVLVLVRT